MEIVFDFITGKISADVFQNAWNSNPDIGLWIESLIDYTNLPYPEWDTAPYPGYRKAILKYHNGSFLSFIKVSEESSAKYIAPFWTKIGGYFRPISSIVCAAYPSIVPTPYYDQEIAFYSSVIGEYLGGPEVEQCISNILKSYPCTMKKSERRNGAKTALKALFHITGSKYPRWVQSPEWPMGLNSPMAFSGQTRIGDLVQFTFQDVDTQEIRVIEQYY